MNMKFSLQQIKIKIGHKVRWSLVLFYFGKIIKDKKLVMAG